MMHVDAHVGLYVHVGGCAIMHMGLCVVMHMGLCVVMHMGSYAIAVGGLCAAAVCGGGELCTCECRRGCVLCWNPPVPRCVEPPCATVLRT